MEGRANNTLFSFPSREMKLILGPHHQLSSSVNHYPIHWPCRPWLKQCFPFRQGPQSTFRRWCSRLIGHAGALNLIAFSPTAVLLARRKVICPICTTDDSKPIMIEEGREWEAHARSKVHRHLAAKRAGNRHFSATVSGTGEGPGRAVPSVTDELVSPSLGDLFGP